MNAVVGHDRKSLLLLRTQTMIEAATSQSLLEESPRPGGAAPQPIVYSSAELLQGRREVWIEHGDQMYRLRITSAKKLYLTK